MAAAVALCAVAAPMTACGRDGPPIRSAPSASTNPGFHPGVRYAHLGDSFAAGSGIDPIVADSPAMCLRSRLDFGQLVAARHPTGFGDSAFADMSCAGAGTADLSAAQYFGVPPQAGVLGPATELVTMMIGGNDGRLFADAVAQCSALAGRDVAGAPCGQVHEAQVDAQIAGTIAPALSGAVALVTRRAPRARVLVVGYPRLLPPRHGCYPTMRIAAGDVDYLNRVQLRLNGAIAGAARAHRATYLDLWSASRGHDACAPPGQRWIEPMLRSRIRTTVHPNAAGQRAIAEAVLAALN